MLPGPIEEAKLDLASIVSAHPPSRGLKRHRNGTPHVKRRKPRGGFQAASFLDFLGVEWSATIKNALNGFLGLWEAAMSIFGSIISGIFGHAASAASPDTGTKAPEAAPATAPTARYAAASPQVASSAAPQSAPPAAKSPVDVAAIMDKLASQAKEKLEWRKSIVDLMKLLNLDSSIAARKQLAQELHYSGNMHDSASMNIWLHKQVMLKLAERGGKVPDELRH